MTLKPYKIDLSMYEGEVRRVVSEAVQKKAWNLGYPGWDTMDEVTVQEVNETSAEWLYFDNFSTTKSDCDGWWGDDCELIPFASFLALPEPANADNR